MTIDRFELLQRELLQRVELLQRELTPRAAAETRASVERPNSVASVEAEAPAASSYASRDEGDDAGPDLMSLEEDPRNDPWSNLVSDQWRTRRIWHRGVLSTPHSVLFPLIPIAIPGVFLTEPQFLSRILSAPGESRPVQMPCGHHDELIACTFDPPRSMLDVAARRSIGQAIWAVHELREWLNSEPISMLSRAREVAIEQLVQIGANLSIDLIHWSRPAMGEGQLDRAIINLRYQDFPWSQRLGRVRGPMPHAPHTETRNT